MLKDAYFSDIRRYVSRTKWEPVGFFSEGLCNSTSFNLKLGFFSSSAINLLSDGFAEFIYNGGRMRMVINDILSPEDKEAIKNGLNQEIAIPALDLNNIESIKSALDERGIHFFECLSWLIRNNRIGIKIISPKDGIGISHFKCGYFSDSVNTVAFEGSCNFSRMALIENNESISIFCNWDGVSDNMRTQSFIDDFEKTFSGEDDTVKYLDAENLKSRVVKTFHSKEIEQLLKDEQSIITNQVGKKLSTTVLLSLQRARVKVASAIQKERESFVDISSKDEPHFPYASGPRPYQQEAFRNWKGNGQKGLFAMATGTGKTITALNCLLEIYKSRHYYKALILVPTITLLDQWKEECEKLNFSHIYTVSNNSKNWRNDIERIMLLEEMDPKGDANSYIIIATYASFARENIFKDLMSFPKKKLLLIADEAHNMGSKSILDRLDAIHYIRRIGLSATPERQYDEDGNKAIHKFFGAEDKYTFEFSMQEAISKGFLCRYYYYPHLVRLTDDEMTAYKEISKKLAPMFNYHSGKFGKNDEILTALLLKRKRIIHKATNKLAAFHDIIENHIKERGNLKYTLVYVPEGNVTDSNNADLYEAASDDDDYTSHLIDTYTKEIKNVRPHTTVMRFMSDTNERKKILHQFAFGELEVLTSMKCLDEGVDVPRSETAIFCASTGNPRQFIQRRGRILRKHPDKHFAYIHDLIVAPEIEYSSSSYNMERCLLGGELRRVRDFALLSENADASITELENILDYYKLSIF